ncbi:hypothetical protein T01_10202 [Trichinella spiralis]|uniref:Uncharacterized protein n=1 Tax=Trichinella spiralis TaxID=6334 RepID=A0A0V1BWJ9_TRISP|nr:hypothetical protein T01_10202 [Trichinella spiralis]
MWGCIVSYVVSCVFQASAEFIGNKNSLFCLTRHCVNR